MAVHTIRIPDWHPASVNRLLRGRWTAARAKRADRDLIAAYAILCDVPRAGGRRRVSLEVVEPHAGHLPDADNCLKSALDGLVRAGLLRDDSAAWCELGRITIETGPRRGTTIWLEDCA